MRMEVHVHVLLVPSLQDLHVCGWAIMVKAYVMNVFGTLDEGTFGDAPPSVTGLRRRRRYWLAFWHGVLAAPTRCFPWIGANGLDIARPRCDS